MADKSLVGTRVVMIIAPEEFRDEELLTPKKELTEAGADVKVASTRPGEASGMLGAKVSPDLVLSNVRAEDFDAIIIVGGMGSPEHLWDDRALHTLLKNMHSQGKVVAAICLSGAVLAKAGILNGKQATVWPMPESLKALKDGKANYLKQPVVQDGRVVTADGPEAAHAFASTIIKELSKVKV
ncbi:MAG TPA: DJ-1/PfpI family protein [Candidatus Obscuribacterales bacterium]